MAVGQQAIRGEFMTAYEAYQPFADPAAIVASDDAEFEAWMSDHDAAAIRLADAAARSAGQLALKIEAAVELAEANAMAEASTMSDAEKHLLRACVEDAWSLASAAENARISPACLHTRHQQLRQLFRNAFTRARESRARARRHLRQAFESRSPQGA